jgi:sugar (pentulose or hexulose) kinase
LEGVAYQIRANLDVTEQIAGAVDQVILFGGGAKSALWREIIGDVLDRPLAWTRTAETASLGAAMLAGNGCGLFRSLAEARDRMRGPATVRQPDPEKVALYRDQYARYRRTEAAQLSV